MRYIARVHALHVDEALELPEGSRIVTGEWDEPWVHVVVLEPGEPGTACPHLNAIEWTTKDDPRRRFACGDCDTEFEEDR